MSKHHQQNSNRVWSECPKSSVQPLHVPSATFLIYTGNFSPQADLNASMREDAGRSIGETTEGRPRKVEFLLDFVTNRLGHDLSHTLPCS